VFISGEVIAWALPNEKGPATRPKFILKAGAQFSLPMSSVLPVPRREILIQGLTQDGRAFRPSDWAERLAGVMSPFRPGGVASGPGAHIGYSPYCVPRVVDGVKCVVVNEAIKDIEPMAWDFVMNFARDNALQVADVCWLPDA
jgi:hypothetical protein